MDMNPAARSTVQMGASYQNPMTLPQEWEDYGIGDPYVLRHDGQYYLYCSTKDGRIGVKAWSSADLANWTYEGLVAEEPVTEGAYAPEVVYWNGAFYMYTSPAGKGHYVLRSDTPTGPFLVQTDNLGLTIDGSVFIDDDGSWSFTHAEFGGIMAAPMSDPYTIGAGEKLGASLGHWTEGSMIVKRGGKYYMTYTGNHVFSRGYRVNYAVSDESPAGPYRIPDNNPILLSTEEGFNGLGHSSTVLGPDLDSYYIFYHNLEGRSAEGPPVRHLNMDRLAFSGDKMSVLGPTWGIPTEAPKLPVFHDRPGSSPSPDKWEQAAMPASGSGRSWVSRQSTDNRYTAEFNVVVQPDGKENGIEAGGEAVLEMLLSYRNERDSRVLRIDGRQKKLIMAEQSDGAETIVFSGDLPQGTELSVLHALRAESDGDGTRVYWDGLLLSDVKAWKGISGKIGYRWPQGAEPVLSYTAFSNEAGGSSDRSVVKPLPGTLEAAQAVENPSFPLKVGAAGTPDGSLAAELGRNGELAFPVQVKKDGRYRIAVMAERGSEGAALEVEASGRKLKSELDAVLFSSESEWTKVPLGELELKGGLQWLAVKQKSSGVSRIRYIEVLESAEVDGSAQDELEKQELFGSWEQSEAGSRIAEAGRDSKLFAGDARWGDYELDFRLQADGEDAGEAAVLLRTSRESDYPAQVADSFIGYQLVFRSGRIILEKIVYERKEELDSALLELRPGQPSKVSVKLEGGRIRVFREDGEPLLDVLDPDAILQGRIGFRSSSRDWIISGLEVRPVGHE
ncbi:glycoside hydrolase family 43 protein [Paenibacillus sp. D51F]